MNTLWLLKNILFQSESKVKSSILKRIDVGNFYRYIGGDHGFAIQNQAVAILRNILCGNPEDISTALKYFGISKLVELLRKQLFGAKELTQQVIYVLVNICTGGGNLKDQILNEHNIIEHAKKLLLVINHKRFSTLKRTEKPRSPLSGLS